MNLIVGAGPIGLEMAIEFSRVGAPFRLVDAGNFASTIEWYAPGTEIFSSPERIAIAGVPFEPINRKANREDYLLYLRNVVKQFAIPVESYRRVIAAKQVSSHRFLVTIAKSDHGVGGPLERPQAPGPTDDCEEFEIQNIILAIGNLHVPQRLAIPGEDAPHVSHYLAEPHRYARTKVTIVGSGNSAAEAAIRLYHVGAKVTLVQRKGDFREGRIKPWLLPELRGLIKERKIVSYTHFKVSDLRRNAVVGRHEGKDVTIECDFVLLLTGYRQRTELFEQLGVKVHDEKPVVELSTMQTNIPGVYVIGTAAAGTETTGVTTFIENAHVHVKRVLHALHLGPEAPAPKDRPIAEREN